MNCPHCNIPLSMADRAGIEIDFCPECRGVWLDRGELDKIIERSAEPSTPSRPARYDDGHPRERHEGGYAKSHGQGSYHAGRKKKKGFGSVLEDIFDF